MLRTLASVDLLTGAWDLRTFLENSFSTLEDWFSLAVMIVGLCAVAWAIWQIVSGLMSQGKKQTNWAVAIILLIVGGALSVSTGFSFVRQIAEGGQQTISDLGGNGGVIHLQLNYLKSLLP